MTTRREFLRVALGTGAALLLAACGSTGSGNSTSKGGAAVDADVQKAYDAYVKTNMPGVPIQLIQDAKREGKVVYYAGQTSSDDAMIAKFQEVFPFVQMESIKLSGGNLVQRFMTEYRAGQRLADVTRVTSMPDAIQAKNEGFLAPYTPSVADQFAAEHQIPGYVYPTYVSIMGLSWNTQKIKDEDAKVLQKWEGLADPRWKGKKFGVVDISAGGTYDAINYVLLKKFGQDIWLRLAENFLLFPGIEPMADAVVRGEVDLGAGGAANTYNQKWDQGAPIHWHYPEPIVAVPVVQFICADTPHPNAAKLLTEFSFSVPMQELWVNIGNFSQRQGVQDTRKVKSESWFVPADPAKFWPYNAAEIDAGRDEVRAKWNAIFKK